MPLPVISNFILPDPRVCSFWILVWDANINVLAGSADRLFWVSSPPSHAYQSKDIWASQKPVRGFFLIILSVRVIPSLYLPTGCLSSLCTGYWFIHVKYHELGDTYFLFGSWLISLAVCTGIRDMRIGYFWSARPVHSATGPTVLVLMFLVCFLPTGLGMVHVCSPYVARTQPDKLLHLGMRTSSQKQPYP